MKILLVHNSYQMTGGEDAVVAREHKLLVDMGHRVILYFRTNGDLKGRGISGAVNAGVDSVWSSRSYREVAWLLKSETPDVAHFHNSFPLISPAAYYACAEEGVQVVQTLHNYRLLCPGATLLRNGKVCEDCLGRSVPWPGVFHACYRDSRAATAAVATMLTAHRAIGTWRRKVDVYVALTEFARRKFVEGGLPAERIVVKPNFMQSDPGMKTKAGKYALYVGRLSEEKGIELLPKAWAQLRGTVPLKVVGGGSLREKLSGQIAAAGLRGVELVGQVGSDEIMRLLHGARFLILPSICYENFPLAIVEAFACGVSVIASRLGSMAEIVEDGKTGLHFTAGDETDLATKVEWAWTHPEKMDEMGRAARREFEDKYTSAANYKKLMEIYETAMAKPVVVASAAEAVT